MPFRVGFSGALVCADALGFCCAKRKRRISSLDVYRERPAVIVPSLTSPTPYRIQCWTREGDVGVGKCRWASFIGIGVSPFSKILGLTKISVMCFLLSNVVHTRTDRRPTPVIIYRLHDGSTHRQRAQCSFLHYIMQVNGCSVPYTTTICQ